MHLLNYYFIKHLSVSSDCQPWGLRNANWMRMFFFGSSKWITYNQTQNSKRIRTLWLFKSAGNKHFPWLSSVNVYPGSNFGWVIMNECAAFRPGPPNSSSTKFSWARPTDCNHDQPLQGRQYFFDKLSMPKTAARAGSHVDRDFVANLWMKNSFLTKSDVQRLVILAEKLIRTAQVRQRNLLNVEGRICQNFCSSLQSQSLISPYFGN